MASRQKLERTKLPFLVEDWGRSEYQAAFDKQKDYVRERIDGQRPDTLVYTEHQPVFTLGLRRGAENNLIWNEEQLLQRGIAVHQSNRGGDITYHGPGQLTGYPIFSLHKIRDLHLYLRLLEATVIQALEEWDLEAGRREGKTGIWIGTRKIAAIGVAVKSWVSYHGFALNVTNQSLAPFAGIVPCGITDGTVTSLEQELGFPIDLQTVKPVVSQAFKSVFGNYLS